MGLEETIVLGIALGTLLIGGIAACIFYCYRKRQLRNASKALTERLNEQGSGSNPPGPDGIDRY